MEELFGSCLLIGITHCLTFYWNRTSHSGVHSVHCSVFKGHRVTTGWRRLVYFNKLGRACQGL